MPGFWCRKEVYPRLKKMKKKLLLALIVLILIISIGTVYLNKVILPTKIKALIILSLQEATGKKVTLESLQFNIFKGLVLKNLVIYDEQKTLARVKESSCSVFFLPIFRKQIIIPSLRINSARILLVRRSDNTFNIQDLFLKKAPASGKRGFNLNIYRLSVRDSRISFRDETFSTPFTKDIEDLNLNVYFSLPVSAKFNLKAKITGSPATNISSSGEFKILGQQWTGKIAVGDFSPKEFAGYYQNSGLKCASGTIDCSMNFKVKDDILYLGAVAQSKDLNITKDKIGALLNSETKANIQYGLKDKTLAFSGKSNITNTQLFGIEVVQEVRNIDGELSFDTSGLSADNLKASVWGTPINAKIRLKDFSKPAFNINLVSSFNLANLQKDIKEKLKASFLSSLNGEARLAVDIQIQASAKENPQINGYFDIYNAFLKIEKINSPLENINGRFHFTQNQLSWSDLTFKYSGASYKTGGILTNFQAPGGQLALSSPDLILETTFNVNNQLISFAKLTGKYFNSDFVLAGNINTGAAPNLPSEIKGDININLEDLTKMIPKSKAQIEKIKPSGVFGGQFDLKGNINDFKNCSLEAKLNSSGVSFYGLKADEVFLSYSQKEGRAEIPFFNISLYGGAIVGDAIINLKSANPDYALAANINGIKIEKLKMDTPFKKEDLAGTLQAQAKVSGLTNDISALSGSGKIYISEGKLWQLNLFQGLGSLLFAQDFANIIFHEGSCSFSIKDKYASTDDLVLKSNITSLAGSVRIGFDSSIDASLKVEVLDQNVPLSGTFKDITTAIVGRSGIFGVINITGTLKQPKYKFKPAVENFIKGITNMIFGK